MMPSVGLDNTIRQKLRTWPNHPPGLEDDFGPGAWIKGRPAFDDTEYPFLKLPGANRLRTVPDGFWMRFGGTPRDLYVDIFVIEVCGCFTNLLDKRSRFAPSMHSMLAVCPLPWLLGPYTPYDDTPRWRCTRLLKQQPDAPLTLPVRDIRVMYALPPKLYDGFESSQIPHAHEFFAPVTVLLGPQGWQQPSLRAFIARTSPRANFWAYGIAAE
jgi:hypothetical protein